ALREGGPVAGVAERPAAREAVDEPWPAPEPGLDGVERVHTRSERRVLFTRVDFELREREAVIVRALPEPRRGDSDAARPHAAAFERDGHVPRAREVARRVVRHREGLAVLGEGLHAEAERKAEPRRVREV